MRNTIRSLAAALGLALTSLPANAVLFTFSNEFSGPGGTCVNISCGSLSVVQNGANVDFLLTANMTGGELITGFYGNRDPFALEDGSAVLASIGGTGAGAADSFEQGLNAFKADGDGFFDWVWNFETSNSPMADRLDGVETFSWTFDNVSINDIIDAISVNGSEGKDGFTFVLRAQGLTTGSGSGWFYAVTDGGGGETELPEPGMLGLLGLGLLTMAFFRRRKAIA